MRTSFIVGAVAFVFAVGGMSACGGKEGNGKKLEAQKVITKAEVTPAAIREPAGTSAAPSDVLGAESKGVKATLVLGEGGGGFPFNAKTLSDEAKARIDGLFAGSKPDPGAHFEIEGYTDNLGSKAANERVGLARADAVKQYLNEKYEIPLDAISVISYGADKPVADNATEDGRALNRRVVIKVLD